jgi:hypothetical protein
MNTVLHESFLQFVRLGIGTSKGVSVPKDIDWAQLKAIADAQGLTAIVLDGIDKLNTNLSNGTNGLPLQMKLEWIGEVLQNYEQRYKSYEKAISSLAGFYNQNGLKMMVLKGYACALDWPKPNHRPCGDIDIWQFGQYREADSVLSKEKGIKIDNSHHHHTVFNWNDFMVENHYDFVNVHHSKSNAEIEKEFKTLGDDDSYYVEVNGEKVYLPSPNLHALFLLRHAMIEFAAGGINLRQLIDWAFFVKAHGKDVDWEWLESLLEEYGMKRLYDVFNAICVGDLGFDVNIFPKVQFDPALKEKVLNDILSPAIPNEKPEELLQRVIWKWHRWKANEWKHQLVYKESMCEAFWSGVWEHLLKPTSI